LAINVARLTYNTNLLQLISNRC